MYDAVVALRPYTYHQRADPGAAAEAAANLAADYADSLAAIPNGRAETQGRLVGAAAAPS